jgi:outer membrane PBP1 activator LpoA protein
LYEQKNFTAAKNILAVIDVASLPPDLKRSYVLQQAALALNDNDTTKAAMWLNDSILEDIPDDNISQKTSFHELRAKVFVLKNQFFDSTKEYLLLLSITPKTDQQLYVDALWDSLSKTDTATLTDVHTKISSSDLYNWVELTLITKDTSLDKQEQQAAITKWFAVHPDHPMPSLLFKMTYQTNKP